MKDELFKKFVINKKPTKKYYADKKGQLPDMPADRPKK